MALREGRIVAEGTPAQVVTEATVRDVFGIGCRVVVEEETGDRTVIPLGRSRATAQPAPGGLSVR